MKILLRFILSFAAIMLMVSCSKDEKTTIPLSGDYLPMQVRNYWKFNTSQEIAIAGTKIIDSKTYFIFIQGNDTSYYRNVANKIYVRKSSGNESVKFDLTASTGEEWKYQEGGTVWDVTLSGKTDTVSINTIKIPNCYRFFFDIPLAIDDEHDIWLAPGIGFIKMNCGECLYPSIDLINANINGNEITFP